MHWETTAARGGVNHILAAFRVEHLHAHVNHVPWREVLPFFAFGGFTDEIFKRLVNNL